jgi:hypothetical protein
LVCHYGAKLFILHVAVPFSVPRNDVSEPIIDRINSQQIAEAEGKLDQLATKHSRTDVEHELVLEQGLADDSILKFAEDNK